MKPYDLQPRDFDAGGAGEAPIKDHPYGYDAIPREPTNGLLQYWPMVRRNLALTIASGALGGAMGLIAASLQKPTYRATASIEIRGINENFLNIRDVSPTRLHYEDIQTQTTLLQSRSLLRRVIHALEAGEASPSPGEAATAVFPRPELEAAAKTVTVTSTGGTRVVSIACESPDPKLAASFADGIAKEYIKQNQEDRWDSTQKANEFLTRQIQDLRIKLERSEADLQSYARANGLRFTAGKDSAAEETLKQMESELLKAQADRISKQSRYELASSALAESQQSLPEVLDDESQKQFNLKIADLRRQLAELNSAYHPTHYKVQRVQAQIDELTSAMRKNRAEIVNRLRHEFEAAQRRETLLAADCARQTRLVSQQRERSIQYEMLQREVDSNRQIYESMLQRVKEARLSAALNAAGVRIVDSAEVPPRPYKPKPVAYACAGILAGLVAGGGAGAMREFAKRTFRRPGDTASCLQLPELGVIASARAELNAGRSRQLATAAAKCHPLALSLNHQDRLELVTWTRSGSLLAECYRTTLASIRLTMAQGNRPKVFVITSAEPEAGKTSVAANLAIALAGIKQRVLIIDADMRRPRIHDIFGLENHSGLSTELSSGRRLASTMVSATEIPGLFALPSGPSLVPASVLVQSPRLSELIRDFRKEFDAVVIDTPPMLHFSDARVLARFADAVILVVRAGHTSYQQALAARQRLAEDCTNVLGTVLNDWDPKDSIETYDGYCGYQA